MTDNSRTGPRRQPRSCSSRAGSRRAPIMTIGAGHSTGDRTMTLAGIAAGGKSA